MKRFIIFAVFILLLLWIGTPWLLSKMYPTVAERGQFGDMFGAVNAIFSGLALLGTIYAVILQQKELELQRQELAQSRAELAHQNIILSEQLKAAKEAHEFAMEKERNQAEPHFVHISGVGGLNLKRSTFRNEGGDIRAIKIFENSVPEGRSILITPTEILKRGEVMTLEIPGDNSSPNLPEIHFSLTFTNCLGQPCKRDYIWPAGELYLKRSSTT